MTTYKIGGSLPANAPSYVERQADRDLAAYLQQGGYCYVLTSRQMGKSSLKVRMKHQLELEGLACAEIDLTGLGAEGVTARQWYNSIADELACQFELEEDFEEFSDTHTDISDVRRLGKFIDEIVLAKIPDRIVIFVDEIDKVISLGDFTDDFFGLIRNFAERANNDSKYQRLSFVLLGVASPNDLIKNKERTPFNIGKAIALYGFQSNDDISPLTIGLQGIVPAPEEKIADILYWTGGQPILTQKLCQLVVEFPQLSLVDIINSKIVENWELQDNPAHLTTIRDRITHPQHNPAYCLEQYRQIVTTDRGITIDDSQLQQWLKLSGLVVERQQKLVVYNPIYARVFDLEWVDRELAKVCPYAPALAKWLDEGKPDLLLLRGAALEEAIQWKESRWQQQQTIGVQNNIFVERSASKRIDLRLEQTKKQIKKLAKILSVIIVVGFVGGLILSIGNLNSSAINKFDEVSNRSIEQYEFTPIESLKLAIENGNDFDKRRWTLFGRDTPTPKLALQKTIDKIHELDEINTYQQGINAISFCRNGNIFSAGNDGAVKLWNRQRQQQSKPKSIIERPETIFQSLYFKDPIGCQGQFTTGSNDGNIHLWDFDSTKNSASLKFEIKGAHDRAQERNGGVQSVRITNDGKYLISTGRADGKLQKWQIGSDDRLISAWPEAKLAHAGGVVSLNLNGDGKTIGTGGKDGSAKIWNLDDGALLHTLKGHDRAVNSVYFCSAIPTTCQYEIATGSSDGTVKLWTADGRLLKTISAHIGEVRIVRFSLDGKLLATASANDPTTPSGSSVRIWEIDSSQLIAEFKGHHGGIESLRFNPQKLPNERQELVTSGREDSTIRVWEIPELLKSSDRHSKILSVRFDPKNSQYFFTAGQEGEIKRWHLEDKFPKLRATYSLGKNVDIVSIRLNPNRGDRSIAIGDSNGKISLLELVGNDLRKIGDFDTGQGNITSIDWSYKKYNGRTDRYLLATTGSQGKDIKLWEIDVDKNKKIAEKSLPLQQKQYTDLTIRFSADGRYLAAAGKEGKWMLIENFNSSESKVNIHPFDFISKFTDKMLVRFSSDSKSIALVGQEGNIWQSELDPDKIRQNMDNSQPIPTYQAGTENAAIGRNDRAIATAGSGSAIRLWDWQGRQIADFRGGWGNIKSIDFSKDGKYILAGGEDGIPRVWRIDRDIPTLIEQGCNWLKQGYLQSHQSDRSNDEIDKICKIPTRS